MNWTKSQATAISVSRRDMLLAAAAGSGKTATLTERVLTSLCREDDPTDISRMLIVTFTNKAADELKLKIRKKLEERICAEPDNARLRAQLSALSSADISTIHSFYGKLVRGNFAQLSLSPRMRTADESESKLLRRRMMDNIIESYYSGDIGDGCDMSDAENFFDTFLKVRPDDEQAETFLSLYSSVSSYPEHIGFFAKNEAICLAAAENFSASPYFAQLKSDAQRGFSHFGGEYERLIKEYSDDELFSTKYFPSVSERVSYITYVLSVFETADYNTLRKMLCDVKKFTRLGMVRGEYDFKAATSALNGDFNEFLKAQAKYFAFNAEDVSEICRRSAELCGDLFRLMSRFRTSLDGIKREQGILDFDDLERLSYKLLCAPDGTPTEAALSVREKYDEIYIDEYQDVNATQDAVFAAISKNNRFMVGDVKQSIYSFRGAMPAIFSAYREKFPPYNGGEGASTLFLSDNFRCGKPIVDFTNIVFGRLFGSDHDGLAYGEPDALKFCKAAQVRQDIPVQVTYINAPKEELYEADYIAAEIRKLLSEGTTDDGVPIKPDDIAVLCRGKKLCGQLQRRLEALGIPVFNAAKRNFFDSPEVSLAVSVLSAIDNPMHDIPLAAAMRSPVFGFTLDELAAIREKSPDAPLYSAVKQYTDETKDEKCQSFLKRLNGLREYSLSLPTDKFIRKLYAETAMPSLIFYGTDSGTAAERRANLQLLYDFARTYEGGSFKGLYGFITYLNDMISRNASFDAAEFGAGGGCVTIQTIHASKGLEYPAVFLAGCDSKINDRFKSDDIVLDSRLGLGIRTKAADGRIRKGPLYYSVISKIAQEGVRDELRMLYVALTRARKYLYITSYGDGETGCAASLSQYAVLNVKSYAEMLSLALSDVGDESYIKTVIAQEESSPDDDKNPAVIRRAREKDPALWARLAGLMNFTYPHRELSELPKKVSVSKLSPSYLDDTDAAAELISGDITAENTISDAEITISDTEIGFEMPVYGGVQTDTAAHRGTSTHLFMQFCDFEGAEENPYQEAQRLVLDGFIGEEDIKSVRYDEIATFFKSSLYKEMKECMKAGRILYREYRFNIRLDACDFTEKPELREKLYGGTLLVQGVIDCFFENPDGTFTLCDYKTDRLGRGRDDTEAFISRHRQQLSYYKQAIEKLTLKRVSRCELYSFCLGREIEVI